MMGVGGPGSPSATGVNGVVEATSTGIGGGLFRFSDVFSETDVRIDLTVDVQGGTLRGGAVVIDGRSYLRTATSSVGKGGGFLGFGASNAFMDAVNNVTTKVADGATVFSSTDVQVTSFAMTSVNGQAVNRTGGLIAGADTDVDAEIGYAVRTEIGGDIVANRSVLIGASAGYNGVAIASSGSGGLGTNSDANDDSSQGVGIGREHAATVDTVLLGTASLRGAAVQVAAGSGVRWNIDLSDGSIDAINETVRALATSTADAYALGADSDASAYVSVNDNVTVTLSNGSYVEGDAVTIRAQHANLNLTADASANCGCGGGDTDAYAEVRFTRRLPGQRRGRIRDPHRRTGGLGADVLRPAVRPGAPLRRLLRRRILRLGHPVQAQAGHPLGVHRLPARRAQPRADHRRQRQDHRQDLQRHGPCQRVRPRPEHRRHHRRRHHLDRPHHLRRAARRTL